VKILTVIGARPQFIKASAISRSISRHKDVTEVIVHTGQHFDPNMSAIFFEEMEIPQPKYNLEIHSVGHGAMTGRMLEGIEKIIQDEKPDYVLVYGDTNSTLAGALAAKKLHVKVAHIEAGLRSYDMQMPEEVNRILTDRISDFLFCPTDAAIENLKKEGFGHFDTTVIKTGDVMYDSAFYYAALAKRKSTILEDLKLTPGKYVLATIHRQENTDNLNNLKHIIAALNEINETQRVVVPLHPRSKNILQKNDLAPAFTIIDPVGYLDMVQLISSSSLIITDSGGLQKEAFFFHKNCVTMREQTEWVELVDNGFNMIAGTDTEKIVSCYKTMITKLNDFSINLYGTGKSAEEIIDTLIAAK
jgi:UDP-GlcNAc3NAcA epimerase